MIKVSVIVPIYNVEQYLEKCLDSLVNQTLKEIEIILVNDASPDASDVIMERYREKYDNIKTIYFTQNKCQGGARNAGIEIASGKYVTFVDSDDWLDLDYLEKMYDACEESGSDVAYSAYKSMSESGIELSERMFWPMEFSGELTAPKKRGIINKGVFAWGKLYSLALWRAIGLSFPEHLKYEDAPTVPIYMLHAKSCYFVSDTYYRYLSRKDSTMHIRNVGHDDAQKTTLIFSERMKKYGFYEEYFPEIEHYMVERYYCVYLRRCLQLYDEIPYTQMEEARKTIRSWFPNFEKNPYYYMFVAEDRMRMQMNEISPYACAIWEQKFKHEMARDEILFPSMYLPLYKSQKELIDCIMTGKKRVGLYGDKHKKKALLWFLNKYYSAEIIDFENAEALKNSHLEGLDIVIGVNPNACLTLHQAFATVRHTKVINIEDILHGFIKI